MRPKEDRKGQVFTLDMFLAVLGIIIVLSYASEWYQQAYLSASRTEQMKLDQLAQDIAQIAVKDTLAYHDEYGNRYPNLIKGNPNEVKQKMQDLMTQTLGGKYAGGIILLSKVGGTNYDHVRACDPEKELVGMTRRLVYYHNTDTDKTGQGTLLVAVCPLAPDEQQPGLNPSNLPNLEASVSLDPANPNPGSDVKITVTVKNTGQQDAGQQFKVDVRLDDPRTGALLDSRTVNSLQAGGSTIYSFTYTAPGEEGSHILYAVVDTENTVTETSETDNIAHAVFTVGLPDLIVLSINPDKDHLSCDQTDSNGLQCEALTGKYTLRNVGIGDANVNGVHNTVNVTLPDGTLVGTGETAMTGTLLSGSNVDAGINIALAGSKVTLDETNNYEQQLTVKAVLDDKSALDEESEDNNQGTTTVWVGLPNIKAVRINFYDVNGNLIQPDGTGTVHLMAGQQVNIKAVIQNDRDYDVTSQFNVRVCTLSPVGIAGSGLFCTTEFDESATVEGIEAGQEQEVEVGSWTVPEQSNYPVSKNFRITVDVANEVVESDESEEDNQNVITSVIEPPAYDLAVTGMSFSNPHAYEPTDVTLTISNEGVLDYPGGGATVSFSGLSEFTPPAPGEYPEDGTINAVLDKKITIDPIPVGESVEVTIPAGSSGTGPYLSFTGAKGSRTVTATLSGVESESNTDNNEYSGTVNVEYRTSKVLIGTPGNPAWLGRIKDIREYQNNPGSYTGFECSKLNQINVVTPSILFLPAIIGGRMPINGQVILNKKGMIGGSEWIDAREVGTYDLFAGTECNDWQRKKIFVPSTHFPVVLDFLGHYAGGPVNYQSSGGTNALTMYVYVFSGTYTSLEAHAEVNYYCPSGAVDSTGDCV